MLEPAKEVPTSLGMTKCLTYYQQLYCMAVDLRDVTESSYLFLNLLPEAEETWSTPCSSLL